MSAGDDACEAYTAIAPAYDFVSTVHYIPDVNTALRFVTMRRMDGLTRDELVRLAGKARLPEKLVLDAASETVARFHETWKAENKNLPLSKELIETIESHVKKVPIARM